jgi:hypothetical protein
MFGEEGGKTMTRTGDEAAGSATDERKIPLVVAGMTVRHAWPARPQQHDNPSARIPASG